MIVNLIFQKDKIGEKGFVFVNFKDKGKPPTRLSTKTKMTKSIFENNKNKVFPIFNPTKDFDYNTLNQTIQQIIFDYNNSVILKDNDSNDFIKCFEEFTTTIINGGTKTVYTTVLNRLKKRHPNGLPKSLVNTQFIENLSIEMRKDKDLTSGYVRSVIQKLFHVCKKQNIIIETTPKDLQLKKTKLAPTVLMTDRDSRILIDFKYNRLNKSKQNNIYFSNITFGLCQLFSGGSRFSDLILLRFGNFGNDHITVQCIKTKTFKDIGYSVMLLKTMYAYLFKDDQFTDNYLTNVITKEMMQHDVIVNELKSQVLDEVRNRDPNDFFFDIAPKEMMEYDNSREYDDKGFKIMVNSLRKYNYYLEQICKTVTDSEGNQFDNIISSHSFRYKFVANCLNKKIPIYDISTMLGHKHIATTEGYILKHFGPTEKVSISNSVDSVYY